MQQCYYPPSFPSILLIVFPLGALPPVFALVNNATSIDRLANRSQNEVYQAVQASQSSRRLSQLLVSLERTARQIAILDDRSLLDAYRINRPQFEPGVREFVGLPVDKEQRAALDRIIETEAAIFAVLSRPGAKGEALKPALERFGDI